MENLTKDSLNNQIVVMRNLIKRVKALTINGLIKKSRKLKKSPHPVGSEPLKKDKKLDRILIEIHEIKKLNADEITKFALMHTGKFSDVAKQGSIKDRALARLAENKLLTTSVSQFRTKYTKWQVQVPSLFHIWEFNKKVKGKNLKPIQKDETVSKKAEIKSKEVENNSEKVETINRKVEKKEVENNSEKVETINRKVEKKEVESNCEKVETINRKVEKKELPKKKCSNVSGNTKDNTATKLAVSATLLGENAQKEDANGTVTRPTLVQLSKNLKSKQWQDLTKTDGDMEIRRFNLDDVVGTEFPINASKQKPKIEKDATITKKPKVRNSFFITSDDEDTASSADETEKDNSNFKDDNSEQMHFKKQPKSAPFPSGRTKFQNTPAYSQKKSPHNIWDQGMTKPNRFMKPIPTQSPKSDNMPSTGKHTHDNAASNSTKLATSNLHPSWQAKRKQNNTMSVAFEGKKIKFGDD